MKRAAFGLYAFLALALSAEADDAAPSDSGSGVTSVASAAALSDRGSAVTSVTSVAGPSASSSGAASVAASDYAFCTVCHGAHGNGNPAINAPKIAGIEPWYLKQQLTSFRAGLRGTKPTDEPGLEMQPVGVQLDDAAIEAVAAYVAKFEPAAPPVTVQGDPKKGRTLYATCSGCHGTSAEGNGALKAPALAGQTDWYLVRQLERFRNGERGFAAEDTPGATMRAAAGVLSDAKAVNDLVAYINTLSAKHRGT
jgi:cytochrome c oxidase subunit 2